MDPYSSAQDVARCDLCKTAIVQSYCDFCHVNLCRPCIGDHIADEYDIHKIVSFDLRKSTLIYPNCETHQNEDCKYQCEDCNIFVCSHCTAASEHKGHTFLKLEKLYSTIKRRVQSDREELDKKIMPGYGKFATDLENQIASLDSEYEKLSKDLSKQREELHRDINNAFEKLQYKINEIKVNHQSILNKHLVEIKHLQSCMQQTKLALIELEESNEVFETINYSSKIKKYSKIPPIIQVSMPKFIPNPKGRKKIISFIGELIPFSVKKLFDEPQVLKTIKTGHENLLSVACLNGKIYTSGRTADIRCFNSHGLLQRTIKTKSGNSPNDIAVDRDGALLYSDWKTKSIYKVKNDQSEEIIKLPGWTPGELCVSSLGDILVSLHSDDQTQSKVVRYSGSRIKQTIQFDNKGHHLYSGNNRIKFIVENRNLDICVADSAAGAVVVVNEAGKLRFRYTGHSSTKTNVEPRGITTDSKCNILTADCLNHCIHILSEDGHFLRFIDNCDLNIPHGLDVDTEDYLFVCDFLNGNVIKILYPK